MTSELTPPVIRRRVIDRNGNVVAYGLSIWPGESVGHLSHGELMDLSTTTAGQPLHLRVNQTAVAGASRWGWPDDLLTLLTKWTWPEQVVVELPGELVGDDATREVVTELSGQGMALALVGFDGSAVHRQLLASVAHVVVDAYNPQLALLASVARDAGVPVVADGALTRALQVQAFNAGVGYVNAGLAPDDVPRAPGKFSAGEVHSLELLTLLDENPPDMAAVTGLVAADPSLSVSVLRLVNSPSLGLRHPIDSVRRATVLAGPTRLRTVALRSLVGAGHTSVDDLWALLNRALTVWELADDDAGYTAGMLSAVADLRRFPPDWLAQEAGVSDQIVAAMTQGSGPLGDALTAVSAYEKGESSTATIPRQRVAEAWWHSLPESLEIAQALGG